MRFSNKYIVLLSFISAALLFSLATTYGYFVSTVTSNAQDSVVVSGSMSLEFDDGPSLMFRNIKPGDSSIKTFSVTNTGTVEASYTLYLSEVLNNFANKSDLVYSLTSTEANVNIENIEFPSVSSPMNENVKIAAGVTHMYELTVNYLSTEEIQNDNMGKVILAKVEVNNYKSYGTNWPSDDSGVVADQKVENVAALKSLNASVGDTIETQGYYTVGDGGQAYYTIENKSNQTIDNGKYILLDNAKVAKLVHIKDSHNVKQFGAKGDGVTDDKDAIINAIKASQGMFVYFPEGTYMMSNHAIFSNYSDVNLIGEGENTVIKAMENFVTKKAIFRFENVNILNILRMTFDGNDEVNVLSEGRNNLNSYALVDVVGATEASIDSCVFRNTDFDGFRLLNKIDNFSITNSKFVNVNRGVAHNNGYSVDNIYIENNEMEGNGADNSYAIGLNDNIPYNNVFVRNNKTLSFNNGITLSKNNTAGYVHNVYVIGNEVKDSATSIIVVYATNATIKNNIIDSSPIKVTTKGNGIAVESSNMVEISNNIVKNTKYRGIFINEDSNTKVFNNTVIDCGKENINYYFVDIKGPSQNIEFYNNTLTREDTSLHEILMVVHGDGGVRIYDNTLNNGKIRLWGDSSNIYVSNSGTVLDNGTNNTVIP